MPLRRIQFEEQEFLVPRLRQRYFKTFKLLSHYLPCTYCFMFESGIQERLLTVCVFKGRFRSSLFTVDDNINISLYLAEFVNTSYVYLIHPA